MQVSITYKVLVKLPFHVTDGSCIQELGVFQ